MHEGASVYLRYMTLVSIYSSKFKFFYNTHFDSLVPLTNLYAKLFQLYFRIFLCLFAGVVVDKLPKVCLYDRESCFTLHLIIFSNHRLIVSSLIAFYFTLQAATLILFSNNIYLMSLLLHTYQLLILPLPLPHLPFTPC